MTRSKKTTSLNDLKAGLAAAKQGQEEPAPRDIQISAFIPAGTYRRVKIALAEDGLTMRDLVCQLLDQWLAGRQR